jgi:NADH:ubiquinone reductase (H+-translocating)
MTDTASDANEDDTLPHVVIVGGGFAGIAVARGLGGAKVRVTVVDQHNFHTFQPLLYQVATAGLEPADVAYPIRTIFRNEPNVSFRHGRVTSINLELKEVLLANGQKLHFDELVLASGASAEFFGVPGAAEFSLPLYTLADARHLRNQLLLTLEERDANPASFPPGITYVVVGAGPTGVETSGAVMELIDICVRRDRLNIDLDQSHVVLVDQGARVLPVFPKIASTYAKRILEKRRVTVRLGVHVEEVTRNGVLLADGSMIEAAGVIWAAGVSARGTLAAEALPHQPGPQGRLRVNPDLSVLEHPEIWAVGDAAAVLSGKGDDVCPQLAPVAIQSGKHCAEQILARLAGEPTKPFKYRDKGMMATIGRRAAVAKMKRGPVITGTIGWFAWLALHLFYLVGFRNRFRVLTNWFWRYLDWPSGPRLIVADAETAP